MPGEETLHGRGVGRGGVYRVKTDRVPVAVFPPSVSFFPRMSAQISQKCLPMRQLCFRDHVRAGNGARRVAKPARVIFLLLIRSLK